MGRNRRIKHLIINILAADLFFSLPNQRCLADAVDHQGATALHVAAEKGAVEVCWLLLRRTGLHILHVKTHSGLTPLDLCSRGTTCRCV